MKLYKGSVLFEAQVEACGNSYLVIYGRHINGYFCCIPDWNVGCEMAEPSDTYWNYESLRKTKLNKEAAKAIVREIAHVAEGLKPQSKTHIGEVVGEYLAPYLPVSEGYTDNGLFYKLALTVKGFSDATSSAPIVMHEGKAFVLAWKDIVNLANEAGLFEVTE